MGCNCDIFCGRVLRGPSVQVARLDGLLREDAAQEKRRKYSSLCSNYILVPLAMETLEPICKEGSCFLKDLTRGLKDATGDPREGEYLMQRLSAEVWRGNAASVRGAMD